MSLVMIKVPQGIRVSRQVESTASFTHFAHVKDGLKAATVLSARPSK